MDIYDRYLSGQTIQVYDEILAMGEDAFMPANFPGIQAVLDETFQRVGYNLEIIYKELKEIGYHFKTEYESNYERPLHKPLPDTNGLIKKLDKAVKPYGFVPLSLKYFYEIVGAVNFVWDYETNPNFMWDMADPIQIASLDSLVNEVTNEDWEESMEENIADEDYGFAFLELAADDYHKDNISGGPPYSLEITKQPSIDSNFINEPHDTTFINYLRICFEHCGFPGMTIPHEKDNFHAFFERVKPKLKQI